MVSLFLLLGCNLSYIVDLFAALHELASASTRTLLKLASSVRALLKPYGDTLRWLEIVFIFPRLVLQIIFQIQFGLSHQCEICNSNKWKGVESFHHIFSENLLPWQPYNAFSCTSKVESYCVIKRTGRWNVLKLLYYMLLGEIFKICMFKKIL